MRSVLGLGLALSAAAASAVGLGAALTSAYAPTPDPVETFQFRRHRRPGATQGARCALYDKRRAKAMAGRRANVRRMQRGH